MAKPKSFKDLVLGLLLVGILCLAAVGISQLLKGEVTPGDIEVLSGEAEIISLQRVTGEVEKSQQTEGERFEIETDAADFPVIELDGSIILKASEDPYGGMYYTVYEEDFDELYYRSEYFHYPEEPGTYYIVVDTVWGNRKHTISTQHGFALVMPEPES